MSAVPEAGEIFLYITKKGHMDDILREIGAESVEKDANGAPVLKGSSLCASLSHKDDIVAFAVSNEPVGVDVENVTVPRNVARLSKLFYDTERPESLYDFYRIWTAKEAEGKRVRTGITTEILRAESPKGYYYDWGDYLICVMGEGKIQVIDRT